MRATLSYTVLRLMLFFAAVLLLWLFHLRGITLVVVALVVSSIISLPLLSKLRDRMSTSLTGKIDGFHTRLDEGTKAEDVD
jgi:ABC-type proline/glycine betaine transport system permease subunit